MHSYSESWSKVGYVRLYQRIRWVLILVNDNMSTSKFTKLSIWGITNILITYVYIDWACEVTPTCPKSDLPLNLLTWYHVLAAKWGCDRWVGGLLLSLHEAIVNYTCFSFYFFRGLFSLSAWVRGNGLGLDEGWWFLLAFFLTLTIIRCQIKEFELNWIVGSHRVRS